MTPEQLTFPIATGAFVLVFILTFFVFLNKTTMTLKQRAVRSLLWAAAAFVAVLIIWWATENLADIGSE